MGLGRGDEWLEVGRQLSGAVDRHASCSGGSGSTFGSEPIEQIANARHRLTDAVADMDCRDFL